ncbi:wall-associated receptor kinase 3 [Macadamia integrifolia]|uniref:wall-associated receptor kinase 3 n=1 Tax=Macadamia integrifolia TaxID=60698 RepID=UPI001C4F8424|nr:wall-associated receptor kinase 3 [Macadamia integrifolia]
MKHKQPSSSSSSITVMGFFSLLFLPLVSSQPCKKSCGDQILRYPFGSSPGCGDPLYQNYITCDLDQHQLILTTHTGCYTIETIDYDNQILHITDPTMSTCSSTQPSKGFGLDWNAPFTFQGDNVFALLDCSTNSSPLYRSDFTSGSNSTAAMPFCDNQGAPVCSLLYSCPDISTLNLPISTCCVYTPVDLGPAFEIDLQKLQCTSYTAIYSFNGQESYPESWEYGVALKYRFNVENEYPSDCRNCEDSNGVCGYTGADNSFICSCINGINTTTDCYFAASVSDNVRLLPRLMRTLVISSLIWWELCR